MPTIVFTGKVVPVRPPVEIGSLPPVVWEHLDTKERESFAVFFNGSDVKVEVTITEELNEEEISHHRNRALDIARSALDIICFQTGWGLLLYLDEYVSPSGERERLVPGDPLLSKLTTALQSMNFPIMFQMVAGDTSLQRSLNDLITGITWPHAPAINCARAIEGLRRHNNPLEKSDERGKSWGLLQEALNISKEYRESVTKLATSPRHGDWAWIPANDQEDVVVRAWIIMDRYLHYLGRGRKPLSDFGFAFLQ